MFDRCDASGVWEQNWTLATIYIGENCDVSDLMLLDSHIEKLPNGKILITDFISFQYGKLSEKCAAHIPIFKSIEKNKLSLDRVSNRVFYTLKEKETETEEETEEEIKGVQGEKFEDKFELAFDELTLADYASIHPQLNIQDELKHFRIKCNSSKADYHSRDPSGLRLGFLKQLEFSPNKKKPNGTIKNTPSAEIIPKRKEFKRTF